MSPAELEAKALTLLSWLVDNFGRQLIQAAFNAITGSTDAMLIEDVSQFVGELIQAVRHQVEDDKIKALLEAEYDAADAAVDAVEAKKFGPA